MEITQGQCLCLRAALERESVEACPSLPPGQLSLCLDRDSAQLPRLLRQYLTHKTPFYFEQVPDMFFSFPKQHFCCWPHPTKEQSHIVQSKQLQYHLEQINNHTPRPQSPNPAGQSRVKGSRPRGSKAHLYLLPKGLYRVQFLCGLLSPPTVTNILLETLKIACLSLRMGSVPGDF